MVANPDRTDKLANLDKLVPPLPAEVLEYFTYWTPSGYQPQLLSDWQSVVLRLLWHRIGVSSIAPTVARRLYKPMIARPTNEVWSLTTSQSMTIYNKGDRDAILKVDGQEFKIEPKETHSWAPPGDNLLVEVEVDATGTTLVIDYLIEDAN